MSIRTNVKTGNEYFHARLGLPLGRWAQQETQQKYSTPKTRLICIHMLFEPTERSEVGSDSCQTSRCVNPEPTEPASKFGFYPILNFTGRKMQFAEICA